MKREYILVLLLILVLLAGCNYEKESPNEEPNEIIPPIVELPQSDPIEELINEMSLEEKIGQLFIIGLDGFELSDKDKAQIFENKIGGYILYSRNIDNKLQLKSLLNALNEINTNNKIPLFLSVDEEGGKVSRLSHIYTKLRELSALGLKDDVRLSYQYGQIQGLKLASLGFNLNFAPVLDINSNPKNPVIGSRAIGSTAEIVTKHGIEIKKGMESVNIIPVLKHFPGHGDTEVDSHLELPYIDKSYKELDNLELIPFKTAIDKGADMIMTSHILFPLIDDEYPASISYKIINDILRNDLHFDGVVISDDMTMGAIVNNFTLEEASINFLKAGGDILLIGHNSENTKLVIKRIKDAIIEGELNIEDIDSKLYRILSLKSKYNLDGSNTIDFEEDEIDLKAIELNDKLK